MIYNSMIVRDDEENRILGVGTVTKDSSPKPKGPFTPKDYTWTEPSNRFEQPKPNITGAQIAAAFDKDPSKFQATREVSRKESRTAFGQFIMTKFGEDYPDWSGKVNFEAIIEACNISASLKVWYAEKRTEWSNMVQFPTWAVGTLSKEQVSEVQDDIRSISSHRRDKASMDSNIAKHVVELQRKVDANLQNKLALTMKDSKGNTKWLTVIFSLTTENLPLRQIFDIVKYRIQDATQPMSVVSKDDYLTPSMYEARVLDEFKKRCFDHWKSEKDLTDFFSREGVNFVKPGISEGDGDLSDIKDIVLGKRDTQ